VAARSTDTVFYVPSVAVCQDVGAEEDLKSWKIFAQMCHQESAVIGVPSNNALVIDSLAIKTGTNMMPGP
jgi:hypothetical protein